MKSEHKVNEILDDEFSEKSLDFLTFCDTKNKDQVKCAIDALFKKKEEKISEEEIKNFINLPKELAELEEPINIFEIPMKSQQQQPIIKYSEINLLPLKEEENNSKGNNISFEKEVKFKTILYQKRGRKTLFGKKVKTIHGPYDFDNILRKIQVKYISFLISLANDIQISLFGKTEELQNKFKDIDYSIKKKISHKSIENIKKCSYSDILQMNISTQYKCNDLDLNKKTFLRLSELSPILKDFFSQNYLDLFIKYYYNEEKPLKEIFINNKKITLSSNTRNFYYLLQNNKSISDLLKNVVKNVYLRGTSILSSKPFTAKRIDSFENM